MTPEDKRDIEKVKRGASLLTRDKLDKATSYNTKLTSPHFVTKVVTEVCEHMQGSGELGTQLRAARSLGSGILQKVVCINLDYCITPPTSEGAAEGDSGDKQHFKGDAESKKEKAAKARDAFSRQEEEVRKVKEYNLKNKDRKSDKRMYDRDPEGDAKLIQEMLKKVQEQEAGKTQSKDEL